MTCLSILHFIKEFVEHIKTHTKELIPTPLKPLISKLVFFEEKSNLRVIEKEKKRKIKKKKKEKSM